MSLGLRESRRHRQRQRRRTVAKWVVILSLIFAAGYYAYVTGANLAERQVVDLENQVETLSQKVIALENEAADLRTSVQGGEMQIAEWQRRYKRDVPTGQGKALFDLARQKMEDGVKYDRLEFVLQSAENPRDCDAEPVTKRFIAQTPLYKGANDSVGFDNNSVTVTAVGQSAKDAAGNPQAWVDPAEPLTVQVSLIGGKTSEVHGKLPLHHSVIAGNKEYRFTLIPGGQGFIRISAQQCGYP